MVGIGLSWARGDEIMARKAIYSPEESKKRQADRVAQWQKDNTTCINIRLTKPGKARLVAYAEWKGLPVATMLRESAERCMQADGWKEGEEEQEVGERGEAGEELE